MSLLPRAPVLVVGSSDALTALVQDVLAPGVKLETAATGLEALRRSHAESFALAVVDADIGSEPDGVETAYWLRRLDGIPVIVVSTRGDTEMRLRVAAASPDAFLVRPLVVREVDALVSMLVSRRHASDADREVDYLGFRRVDLDTLRRPAGFADLTGREWQVILDVIDTPTARAVATKRGRSPHTVQNQLKSIFRKLGVHSVPELFSLLLRVSRTSR